MSGPPGSGKSTLIGRVATGREEVIMGVSDAATLRGHGAALVHYNILFPYEQRDALRERRSFRARVKLLGQVLNQKRLGVYEATWRSVPPVRASVLLAPRAELLRRVAQRPVIEPLPEGIATPRERWLRIYDAVDLPRVYGLWLAFLRRRGIAYRVLWSVANRFTPVREARIPALLNGATAGRSRAPVQPPSRVHGRRIRAAKSRTDS